MVLAISSFASVLRDSGAFWQVSSLGEDGGRLDAPTSTV
jgi:hypothetical protein